jgi:hypothetical protein
MRKRVSAWWKRFGLAVGLLGFWGLGVSVTSAPGLQAAQKYPRPTGQELQRAEKMVQEVYGRDIAKARTPSEKGKLAQEILRAAREEQDSAVRFAALEAAKRLAIAAQDGRLAVEIVREIVNGFQPAEEITPQERLAEADRLWQQAEGLSGQGKLAKQLDAIQQWFYYPAEGNSLAARKWRNNIQSVQALSPPMVILEARDAKLIGNQIVYSQEIDRIGWWINPKEFVQWEQKLKKGKYKVILRYSAYHFDTPQSLFCVGVFVPHSEKPISSCTFSLEGTGAWTNLKAVDVGYISVPWDGLYTIRLFVLRKVGHPDKGIIDVQRLSLEPSY